MTPQPPECEPEQGVTRVGGGAAMLPVPSGGAATPEAFEGAPTLLAAEDAGSQGAVRVWAPERRRVRWMVALCALVCLFYTQGIVFFYFKHDIAQVVTGSFWLLIWMIALGLQIRALKRPTYLATDDAGIGVTPLDGPAEALGWDEIYRVTYPRSSRVMTIEKAGSSGKVTIALDGYTRARRNELAALIAERARLTQSIYDRNVLVRSSKPRNVLGAASQEPTRGGSVQE